MAQSVPFGDGIGRLHIDGEARHTFGYPDLASRPATPREIELVWGLHSTNIFIGIRRYVYLTEVSPDLRTTVFDQMRAYLHVVPEVMLPTAPLDSCVPLAVPPATTLSVPPLWSVIPLARPPDDTVSVPPLLIISARAVPPDRMLAVPPFRTTAMLGALLADKVTVTGACATLASTTCPVTVPSPSSTAALRPKLRSETGVAASCRVNQLSKSL